MTIQRWLGCFLLLVAILSLVGCGSSVSQSNTLPVSGAAGTWTGTWVNNTAGQSGSLSLGITVNTTAQTAAIVTTLGGSFFGGAAPPPATFSGPFNAQSLSINQVDPNYGTVGITWGQPDYPGRIVGSLTALPNASISRVDFTGVANGNNIALSFTITLATGATQTGTASVSKTA
jgi:hypothetical protein